jgi:hypothetical protein
MHRNPTARPPSWTPGPVTLTAVEAARLADRLAGISGELGATEPHIATELLDAALLIGERQRQAPTLAERASGVATELARVVGAAAEAGITIDPEIAEATALLTSWSAWLAERAEAARP